jgi:hypothetical protein
MAEILQLPDTYVSEKDLKIPVQEKNTVLNVAYAGIFEKGYIGLAMPIKNINDVRNVLGGVTPETKGSFHMLKTMLKATNRMLVSRAFEIDGTKSAYVNISLSNLSDLTYKMQVDQTENTLTETVAKAKLTGDVDVTEYTGTSGDGIGIKVDGVQTDIGLDAVLSPANLLALINAGMGGEIIATIESDFLVLTDSKNGRKIEIVAPLTGTSVVSEFFNTALTVAYGYTRYFFQNNIDSEIPINIVNIEGDNIIFTCNTPVAPAGSGNTITQMSPNNVLTFDLSVEYFFSTTIVDDSSVELVLSATHTIEPSTTPVKILKSLFVDSLGNHVEIRSETFLTFTGAETLRQVNGSVTTNYTLTNSLNTFYSIDESGSPVGRVVLGEDIDFVSYGVTYGQTTGLYDILDDGFQERVKTQLALTPDSIFVVGNTAGAWANGLSVKLYGSTIVNNSPILKKSVKNRTLESFEILGVFTNGSTTEQHILSAKAPKDSLDHDGSQYNIEVKTKNFSSFVSIFMNTAELNLSNLNAETVLYNGDDGNVSISDVSNAYKVFADETIDTPIVMTGTGRNTLSELTTLNQGVHNVLLRKDVKLDTFGIFNAPYYGIFDTNNIQANLQLFADRNKFGIGTDVDKYRTFSTYITVEDTEEQGEDIILPVSVLALANIIETIKVHGRNKSASGVTRGVIGGYKKMLFVPFDKINANELYVRQLNPIQAIGGSKYYINADQTDLTTNSPYKNASTRMLANQIENELKFRVESYRFEDNTPSDRSLLYDEINDYLKVFKGVGGKGRIADYAIDTESIIQEEIITAEVIIWYKPKAKSIHLVFYSSVKVD